MATAVSVVMMRLACVLCLLLGISTITIVRIWAFHHTTGVHISSSIATQTAATARRASFTRFPRSTHSFTNRPKLSLQLHAQKSKKTQQRRKKGFGKPSSGSSESNKEVPAVSDASSKPLTTTTYAPLSKEQPDKAIIPNAPILQNAGTGGSRLSDVDNEERMNDHNSDNNHDSDQILSPEQRAARILREKYGMRTLNEQQRDSKQVEVMQKRTKQMNEWKKKVESDEGVDLMTTLPAPLLKGIDTFLKVGVTVCGISFILAGIGITVEAWSKTTGQPLDPSVDKFIVEIIEPNFTPGLLVLLGFSVSLGIFAAAQLGSAGASYKENK